MTSIDIDTMSRKDKSALLAALQYDLGTVKKMPSDYAPNELAFFEALGDAVPSTKRGITMQNFVETVGNSRFKEAAGFVDSFITDSCSEDARSLVKRSVMIISLECLAAHLKARDIAPTAGVLVRSIGSLEHAVDRRYPGYAASRMLDIVVSGFGNGA